MSCCGVLKQCREIWWVERSCRVEGASSRSEKTLVAPAKFNPARRTSGLHRRAQGARRRAKHPPTCSLKAKAQTLLSHAATRRSRPIPNLGASTPTQAGWCPPPESGRRGCPQLFLMPINSVSPPSPNDCSCHCIRPENTTQPATSPPQTTASPERQNIPCPSISATPPRPMRRPWPT